MQNMKHKVFATQQMAQDLLRKAVAIWRQGNKNDVLEGIEKDPIVSLLLTALAYQECESNNEIEQLKNDIYQEMAQLLVPYHANRAIPACVLLQTVAENHVDKLTLNTQDFTLANTDYHFLPLLRTTVYNAVVQSVVRIDGRRWQTNLQLNQPVNNLNGLAFLIDNTQFKDVRITCNGQPVSLIKPWEYAELPLSDYFSFDTLLYNQTNVFDAPAAWFDWFAQFGKRLFVVQDCPLNQEALLQNNVIQLELEFFGVNPQFVFNKQQMLLNVAPLVNASLHEVTLTPQNPIARVAGGLDTATHRPVSQFLHLLRPASNQNLYSRDNIVLRRAAVERFNVQNLLKLSRTLLNKYSTDFYGFLQAEQLNLRMDVEQMRHALGNLVEKLSDNVSVTASGLYVLLQEDTDMPVDSMGVRVNYLTCNGSSVNKELQDNPRFATPLGISMQNSVVIGDIMPGYDEVNGEDALTTLSKYYMITHNRVVTPADIKILCYTELERRYNLVSSMIESISVKREVMPNQGRVIAVTIQLVNDIFVKRSMEDKLQTVALLLEKIIEVRSSGMLPVQVEIR